jgi:hypothetical protein
VGCGQFDGMEKGVRILAPSHGQSKKARKCLAMAWLARPLKARRGMSSQGLGQRSAGEVGPSEGRGTFGFHPVFASPALRWSEPDPHRVLFLFYRQGLDHPLKRTRAAVPQPRGPPHGLV